MSFVIQFCHTIDVRNRREDNHYERLAEMYKSQERPLDIDSYSSIPARY